MMNKVMDAIEQWSKLTAFNSTWLIALLTIPFFEPAFVSDCLPSVSTVFFILKGLSFCLLVLMAFTIKHSSMLLTSVIVFHVYLLGVTIIMGGRSLDAAKAAASVIGVCLLIGESCETGSFQKLLNVLRIYFLCLLVLTFFTTLLWPNGLYQVDSLPKSSEIGPDVSNTIRFFTGHKNQIIPSLLPGYFASALMTISSRGGNDRASRVIQGIYNILFVVESIIVGSVTSLLLSTLFLVVFIICTFWKPKKALVYPTLAGIMACDIAVTVFRIQQLLNPLLSIFGRNASLSNRVGIWDRAIDVISAQPLFGYGVEDLSKTNSRLLGFDSAHNIYFTTMYYGGMIGLVLLVVSIVIALKDLAAVKTSAAPMLLYSVMGVLAIGIVESLGIGLSTFIAPLALAYYYAQGELEAAQFADERERS